MSNVLLESDVLLHLLSPQMHDEGVHTSTIIFFQNIYKELLRRKRMSVVDTTLLDTCPYSGSQATIHVRRLRNASYLEKVHRTAFKVGDNLLRNNVGRSIFAAYFDKKDGFDSEIDVLEVELYLYLSQMYKHDISSGLINFFSDLFVHFKRKEKLTLTDMQNVRGGTISLSSRHANDLQSVGYLERVSPRYWALAESTLVDPLSIRLFKKYIERRYG